MDVLELPRPVINFLRTMAKESCRYALSWDIFGGPDSVTLTLTWKLIDDDLSCTLTNNEGSTHQLKHGASNTTVDDSVTRSRSSTKTTNQCSSSPRRSRRDDNINNSSENAPVPAIFRSSRGKSLEGNSNKSSYTQQQPQQLLKEHQAVVNSLERTTPTNYSQVIHRQQRKDISKAISSPSDQIYGHLYETRSASVVKCATISSLSSSSPSPQPNAHSSSTNVVTQSQRTKSTLPMNTPPHARKPQRSLINSSRSPTTKHYSTIYTKSRRNHHMARHDEDENDDADDDDDGVDPWVKRFETSLETNEHQEMSESTGVKDCCAGGSIITEKNLDDTGLTPGKVKFKSKPDYF